MIGKPGATGLAQLPTRKDALAVAVASHQARRCRNGAEALQAVRDGNDGFCDCTKI
ncbi:hypothetical protein KCP75_19900 [Salmonella enterica subsp. enterica]|nr:hypothetical protein KCP75_19900 [Salmonella enterica subsp. enterica]